jgi:two-component system sensor histidine kinase UhpB
MSLFWRVFLVNATILGVADVAAELFSPLPDEFDAVDVADLVLAMLAMLIANALLRARLFGPLERLAKRMETADVLRGDPRRPVEGVAEVEMLEQAFNSMFARLEQERREAGRYALMAQEEERRRLARGLHDEVAQSMTAVLLNLKELETAESPEQRARLRSTQQVVRQSLEDVRRLAKELRPELLDKVGLVSALEHLGDSVEESAHIRVNRRFDPTLTPLDPEVELVLYRVAQESLTNVARHAEASEATISLERSDGALVLEVSDDGKGLDPGRPEGGGLRGIRERALIVGGAVSIRPGATGGVEVRLAVPTGG